MTVKEEKQHIRLQIKKRIEELTPEYTQQADQEIVKRIEAHPAYQKANTIFCFVGMPDEINTTPLIESALKSGKRVAVPLCTGKGIMEARLIDSISQLKKGFYGILEPAKDSTPIAPSEIDMAVLPCVSCDIHGNRLGHGGGYYDRFLEHSSFASILICRHSLVWEKIPTEPHDLPIQTVITEKGCFENN